MNLNAYILAADPTWIEASVRAYYPLVRRIIVSYDEQGRGWTGAPVHVEQCLDRLRRIDPERKMVFAPGQFFRPDHTPMENDTHQRQAALNAAADGADWVLSLDTDEVLPNPAALLRALNRAGELQVGAVEWPMRVLYQKTRAGHYLEVCAADGSDRFDYPGPIATRPGERLVDARRTSGGFLRPTVSGDCQSLQIRQPPAAGEIRQALLEPSDAIIHNSWARDRASIRSKMRSWGHAAGWRSLGYYAVRWNLAPLRWRRMRDFHPFAGGLWPALKPCAHLHGAVPADSQEEPAACRS